MPSSRDRAGGTCRCSTPGAWGSEQDEEAPLDPCCQGGQRLAFPTRGALGTGRGEGGENGHPQRTQEDEDSGLLLDWLWKGLCARDTAGGPSHGSCGTRGKEVTPKAAWE